MSSHLVLPHPAGPGCVQAGCAGTDAAAAASADQCPLHVLLAPQQRLGTGVHALNSPLSRRNVSVTVRARDSVRRRHPSAVSRELNSSRAARGARPGGAPSRLHAFTFVLIDVRQTEQRVTVGDGTVTAASTLQRRSGTLAGRC